MSIGNEQQQSDDEDQLSDKDFDSNDFIQRQAKKLSEDVQKDSQEKQKNRKAWGSKAIRPIMGGGNHFDEEEVKPLDQDAFHQPAHVFENKQAVKLEFDDEAGETMKEQKMKKFEQFRQRREKAEQERKQRNASKDERMQQIRRENEYVPNTMQM